MKLIHPSHIVKWGTNKGDVVLGFAWDGEPDPNGETGIELIWGLDEIAIVEAGA